MFGRKRHEQELKAEQMANTIRHQLTRLNLAYREKQRDGPPLVQQIEFVEPLIATPDLLKFEIDMARMPRGVHISDLKDPKVLETLSMACKYPVHAEHKKGAGGGFWLVVEMVERSKIPRLVKFDEMALPDRAPALALPIGIAANGKHRWDDLRGLPHLLIAGATGQGKSVLVNAILCHLARRLPPDRLRLVLIDLKGGMELSFYKGLPHVDRFVTRAIEVPATLAELQHEMDKRTRLMAERARDLDEYNQSVRDTERLPYIVAVVDEIANAMLCRDKVKLEFPDGTSRSGAVKVETESLLADLAARARATGIHLIISTQRPSVDVITGLIKANFPCRIAFGTASEVDSRVIIDDSSALGLPKGRMKFRRNMDLVDIQAPLIESPAVRRLVDAIIRGEVLPEVQPKSKAQIRDEQCGLLLDLAAREYQGKLPIVRMAQDPRIQAAGIGHNRLDVLLAYLAGESVVRRGWMRGGVYRVAWPRRRWSARFPVPAPVPAPVPEQHRASSEDAPAPTDAVPGAVPLEILPPALRLVELDQAPATVAQLDQDPGDQDAQIDQARHARILELANAGMARRRIAREIGGNYGTTLREIKSVLGDSPN
jgi:hypothetical protein